MAGPYTTVARVSADVSVSTTDTNLVSAAISAASEKVDAACRRSFAVPANDTTNLVVVRRETNTVSIPDLTGMPTSVERLTDDNTWETLPLSTVELAGTRDPTCFPYTSLSTTDALGFCPAYSSRGRKIRGRPSVRVTGMFGWPKVPSAVETATRLLAIRYLLRYKMPLMALDPETGGEMLFRDPDVRDLLRGYIRGRIL